MISLASLVHEHLSLRTYTSLFKKVVCCADPLNPSQPISGGLSGHDFKCRLVYLYLRHELSHQGGKY